MSYSNKWLVFYLPTNGLWLTKSKGGSVSEVIELSGSIWRELKRVFGLKLKEIYFKAVTGPWSAVVQQLFQILWELCSIKKYLLNQDWSPATSLGGGALARSHWSRRREGEVRRSLTLNQVCICQQVFLLFFCIFAFFKCKTDWHQTKSFFSHCLCFVLMVNWDWGPLLSRHSVFCRFVAAVLFLNIRQSPFENTHAHIFVQSPALCCLQKKKCFNLYANKKYGCNASILLFQGPQSPVKSKTRGSSASLATKSQFRCS